MGSDVSASSARGGRGRELGRESGGLQGPCSQHMGCWGSKDNTNISEDTHLVGDPAVGNQKGGDEKSKDKKDKSGDSLTAGRLSIFRRSRRQSQPPVAEKEDDPEVELEEPSLEMLESWMEANTGFDALMSCPKGRQLFKQFLVREFSRENLDFW